MESISEAAQKWIRWCHADQSRQAAEGALETVARMVQYSPYADSIVLGGVENEGESCRGYAVACDGAIGYLGRLRYQAKSAIAETKKSHLRTTVVADVVRRLCKDVLGKGVELVQAILPASNDNSETKLLSEAFATAGMTIAARLIQMDCQDIPFRYDESPLAYDFSPLEFRSHEGLPWDAWCALVERTYVDTLDVPILNGVRSIENTLRGYAVGQPLDNLWWWSIHVDDQPIGCLMLTPIFEQDCELTYLGLVPEARGQRYSPEIMDFVGQWMIEQGKHRIVLAVDDKNAPAIHLYESFGFRELQAIDAWFVGKVSSDPNQAF